MSGEVQHIDANLLEEGKERRERDGWRTFFLIGDLFLCILGWTLRRKKKCRLSIDARLSLQSCRIDLGELEDGDASADDKETKNDGNDGGRCCFEALVQDLVGEGGVQLNVWLRRERKERTAHDRGDERAERKGDVVGRRDESGVEESEGLSNRRSMFSCHIPESRKRKKKRVLCLGRWPQWQE
jgi:hypothetical protein